MSKIKAEIVMDLNTGEYDIRFFNITSPGAQMSRAKIADTLKKISLDFYNKCFSTLDEKKDSKLD